MLTDTHAHLDFPQLAADLPGVLARAEAAGVRRVVTIGTGIESSRRALAMAGQYPQVFAVAGVHPNNVAEEAPDFAGAIREIARSPRVVALGETGLDYHYLPGTRGGTAEDDAANKAAQAAAFRGHLDLAVETGLPVVIHERDAWDDTLAVLREYAGRVRAVFHCFGKSPAHAAEVIAMGHLVSFTGIVTFKKAELLQRSAAAVPADKFMVETDCPYLAPVPHRGKPCEPAFARHTAEFIAALRGVSLEAIAAETQAVADGFFRFPR